MVEAEAAWVRGLSAELTSGTFPDSRGGRHSMQAPGCPGDAGTVGEGADRTTRTSEAPVRAPRRSPVREFFHLAVSWQVHLAVRGYVRVLT